MKYSLFEHDWSNPAVEKTPKFNILIQAARFFALQIRAYLANGDSAAATPAALDGLQAGLCLKNEPALIAALVRLAILKSMLQAIGDGLADESWSSDSLGILAEQLGAINLGDDYRTALSGERGFFNGQLNRVAAGETNLRDEISQATGFGPLAWTISRRKVRLNQLRTNHWFDRVQTRLRDGKIHVEEPHPELIEPEPGWYQRWQYPFFYGTTGIYGTIESRYLRAQALLDQTRVAIALERHRLAHGQFPERLEVLVPEFLAEIPKDPWTQTPLIYHADDAGSYQLYSVGENGQDDHARIDSQKGADRQVDAIWFFAPGANHSGKR